MRCLPDVCPMGEPNPRGDTRSPWPQRAPPTSTDVADGPLPRGLHPPPGAAPRVLLLFPPHARNTEPPLGLGLIAAFLRESKVPCRVVDLNAVAGPSLAAAAPAGLSRRARRAATHVHEAVRLLRAPQGYESPARYRSQVEFYAAALASASRGQPWSITPGDFTDLRMPDFGPSAAGMAWAQGRSSPWAPCWETILPPILEDFSPTMIGVSLTYRTQFLPALALAAWVREQAVSLPVVWGGPLLDSLPEETLAWLETTGPVVHGPGECGIAGLLGRAPPTDGLFRAPYFDDLDLSLYFGPRRVIPLTTTRGCYWRRCVFCAESAAPYHCDRRAALFARLDALAAAWAPCFVHFTDNAIPPAVLADLATRGSPAPWWGFVRATEDLADADVVRGLARGGCAMLQLGFESASAGLLERMNKGVDPMRFPTILSNLREAGIKSYVYLLFGLPGETDEDRESSLQLCAGNRPDFLNASLFRLPPSAALAREPERFAMETPRAAPHDRYLHLAGEESRRPAVRRWLSGRFLTHPAIRPVVSRTPRYYKSSHAPFL